MKGKKHSKETKHKMSLVKKGKIMPQKHSERLSLLQKGRIKSEKEIERLRSSALNRPKVECPHCHKVGDISNMKRWHFNNCSKLLKG
jgi:hypothetical protein